MQNSFQIMHFLKKEENVKNTILNSCNIYSIQELENQYIITFDFVNLRRHLLWKICIISALRKLVISGIIPFTAGYVSFLYFFSILLKKRKLIFQKTEVTLETIE